MCVCRLILSLKVAVGSVTRGKSPGNPQPLRICNAVAPRQREAKQALTSLEAISLSPTAASPLFVHPEASSHQKRWTLLSMSAAILRTYTKNRDLGGQDRIALAISAADAGSCCGFKSDKR